RDVNALRVGHARSAGYGRIAVQWREGDAARQSGDAEKAFLLFLESQFMPTPSWADCQASLCREIGRLAGQEPRITAFYGSQEEIQGYSGFWNRPRTSRTCLAMGNVIRIEFEAPVALPPAFCIGAAQLEGYGRILVNPPFLMSAEPAIVPLLPAKPEQAREASPASLSIWPLLRERIISRQMREQVSLWLNEPAWHNFLEDVKKFEKPTASQRNNLRDMGVAAFREMLGKTPGEQWKQAVARCPFTGRRDHLSEIMLKLLDPDIFCKTWRFTPSDLPGQPESADAAKAQRLFVRQLVSTWNKLSRLSSDKE
ncbi:MAG: hypothetical protein HDQ91_04755, partial [Desulfovibrio sp.]|nr:hypothetical protein [Desulfovibrio sp.]